MATNLEWLRSLDPHELKRWFDSPHGEGDERMTELKPCPFCGGEAETVGDDCMEWIAECIECCASSMAFPTEAEAIAAWNARAERTCRNNKDKWSGLAKYLFVCSECGWNLADVGNGAIDISARLMKRCPNCGARVIGEVDA